MRSLFLAAWSATVAMIAACLSFFLVGAFAQSGRFAAAGSVLIIPSFVAAFLMAWWTADALPQRKAHLSRDMRRELRREPDRIALAAEIARMEREAGL